MNTDFPEVIPPGRSNHKWVDSSTFDSGLLSFAVLCFPGSPTFFPQAVGLQWWSQTSVWDSCELGDLACPPYETPTAGTHPLPWFLIILAGCFILQLCPNVLSMLSKLTWRSGEEIESPVWLAVPVAIVMACSGFWHLFQKGKLFFLQNLSHYSK